MHRFFKLHLPKPQFKTALIAGLGAAVAIGLLAFASDVTSAALLIAPFGASCVLLFATPAAPVSQPVNVVCGHVISAIIGLTVAQFLPLGMLSGALAVGFSVAAMMALRVTHPPAGATAFLGVMTGSWSFVLFPVLAGSLALVGVATVFHRLVGNSYPLK